MNNKKVTVKDIAARMGISLSTVNKALTGKGGISEKRRAEVVAVAKEMGYVVNHVAQSLSRKPIKLGIILPSLWRDYFGAVEEGMKRELAKLYHSNVSGEVRHVADADETRDALEYFFSEGVDAIVYSPSLLLLDDSVCRLINEKKLPVFLVGGDSHEIESVSTVNIDTRVSGMMAAELFALSVDRDTTLAVLIGSKKMSVHSEKADAFCCRARELGFSDVRIYETLDGADRSSAVIGELFSTSGRVGGIYVATGTASPILEHVRGLGTEERPRVITTDIHDEIRGGLSDGTVMATVYQNQMLMGRLVIRTAYKFLVNRSSFGSQQSEVDRRINISPQLFLPASMEGYIPDEALF